MQLKFKNLSLYLILIIFTNFKIRTDKSVTYLPLGDSYTICTGASEKESWPKILTEHLNQSNIKTMLLDNPARNGYSTQNLIDEELPVMKKLKPNFVTLLIGVNDWVRGVSKTVFEKNFKHILNELQKELPDKSKILLISIPDFGVTPVGKNYGGGKDISMGLTEFNEIIKKEAANRGLMVVDIFQISKSMKDDKSLVAADGLHPSAKEYGIWEEMILAYAKKLLQ